MELKFLGRGAALNPKEGNNSAYFIEDKQLFLIDCGESVFSKLIEKDLLSNVDKINLLITHTHSDHSGSLGSLILYCFYTLSKKVNIILPQNNKFISNIKKLLNIFGCTNSMYNLVKEENFDNKYNTFQNIRYIKTTHCTTLDSYSILINTQEGTIYYSGDSSDINIIKSLINNNKIDKLYLDTTTDNFPSNPHLNIDILNETIPNEIRNKIYCMHINNDYCKELALSYGFNVVELNDKKDIYTLKIQK